MASNVPLPRSTLPVVEATVVVPALPITQLATGLLLSVPRKTSKPPAGSVIVPCVLVPEPISMLSALMVVDCPKLTTPILRAGFHAPLDISPTPNEDAVMMLFGAKVSVARVFAALPDPDNRPLTPNACDALSKMKLEMPDIFSSCDWPLVALPSRNGLPPE